VARSVAESKLLAGIKAELSARHYLEEFTRAVRVDGSGSGGRV